MKDINKELDEKLDLYDKIVNACMINTFSLSKDEKIILRDFDKNSDMYMFEFEIAKLVRLYSNRQIYMDMGLLSFLFFKFKHRKECELKRIKHSEAEKRDFIIKDMLLFVAEAYGYNSNNFSELYSDIYNTYWKKEKKNA